MATALALSTAPAAFADQQFYSTQLWDVSLHDAGHEGDTPTNNVASCDATSTLWADRQIVFTYRVTGQATGMFAILLHKASWKLTAPVDIKKSPLVTISTHLGPLQAPFIVQTPTTLMTAIGTDGNLDYDAETLKRLAASQTKPDRDAAYTYAILDPALLVLPYLLFNEQGKPFPLTLSFQGNEPG